MNQAPGSPQEESSDFARDSELLLAMFDDALEDAEFDALILRLRNEPALRRHALLLANDEETLRIWAVTAAESPDGASCERCCPTVDPATPRKEGRRRSLWRMLALAAGVACVLAVGVLSSRSTGPLATITRTVDAQWAGEAPDGPRPRLAHGQRIELASGQLEITYNTGVRVWLQGPVSARVQSGRSIEVSHGTLAINVGNSDPESPATGGRFAVVTPKARIVDLGTRFALSIEDDGKVNLVVFEGSVRTESRTAKGSRPIESAAGQAVQIDPDTAVATPSPGLQKTFSQLEQRLYEQTVPAAADHYVRGGTYRNAVDGSGGGPQGDTLLLKTQRQYTSCRRAWIRFDLSRIDYEPAGSATFVFRHNEPPDRRDFRGTVGVFALGPGYLPIPQELGLDWNEDALTWNNAPGNDRHGRVIEHEHCVLLAEVAIDTTADDQPRGTPYRVPIPVLRNVLQEDSSVTLILCVLSQDGHGPNLSLAANDNPEIAGPELIIPLVQP